MKLKLLSLCLLLTGALGAQNSVTNPKSALYKNIVKQLAQRNNHSHTGKKAPYPQLIAQSHYVSDINNLNDSTTYYYSLHNQGAKFDFNIMDYTNMYFVPASQPLFDIDFDGDSWRSSLNIVCDSSIKTDFNFGMVTKSNYTYNGPLLSNYTYYEYYGVDDFYGERTKLIYNGNNQLIAVLNESTEDNIDWDTAAVKALTYDGQNRMASDTFLDFDAGIPLATQYHYDGNGNIVEVEILGDLGFGWMSAGHLTMEYDASNRLITASSESLLNPDVIVNDTFKYTGNSTFHTYWRSVEYENGNPTWEYQITKHLNAEQLPDTVYKHEGLDSDAEVWVFSYNQDGHPTGYIVHDTTGGTITANEWGYYYYNNSLGTPKPLQSMAKISLYPNPAANQLNLSWNDFKPGNVTIQLMNTTGQVVQREQKNWQQSNETLSISGLQPGVYWISITDAQGNMLYRQSLVKQ